MQRVVVSWPFLALFAVGYALMYCGYALLPDSVLRDVVYPHVINRPAQWLINRLPSMEQVVAHQDHLESARAHLLIVRGCDGAGVLFLLLAAVVACRASAAATFSGLLGAISLVYAANEARIVALYWVAAYHASWFTLVHVYVVPTAMILFSGLYFSAWLVRYQDGPDTPVST